MKAAAKKLRTYEQQTEHVFLSRDCNVKNVAFICQKYSATHQLQDTIYTVHQ